VPWVRSGVSRGALTKEDPPSKCWLTVAGQHGATAAELQARAGHASQAAMAIYQPATLDRDKMLADAIGQTYEPWVTERPRR
jgi:hypothetical protein